MRKIKYKLSTFNFPFSTSSGFTMIELLVVIAMLSILIMGIVALINPPAQLRKARDASRKSDLRQIQGALEMYRSDQGGYPSTASVSCPNSLQGGSPAITYMQRVPCDPINSGQLKYTYTSTVSTAYTLVACLENINDSQKDTTSVSPCDTAGVNNWSYTLQNP